MSMPVSNARITNAYKDPLCTVNYAKGYHTGIDFISDNPTVYAALSGVIAAKGYDPPGWGNYVILRHKDKYDLIHAHLSSAAVVRGQHISEGDRLGLVGATGRVTGSHLHFEVRKAPWELQNDIDPAVFLGIYNRRGPAESIKEEIMIKNLIVCMPGSDERAAGYLGDYLKSPVCLVKNVTQELIEAAEKIYVIGTEEKVSSKSINIVGDNRYDTCRKVLDICK